MGITFRSVLDFLFSVYENIMPFYQKILEVLYQKPFDFLPDFLKDILNSLDPNSNFIWFLKTPLISLIFGTVIGFVFFMSIFKWLIAILR